MNMNGCYLCGTPIPELRVKDKKYSFKCDHCGCATKYKDDLFEAQNDWNDGITYSPDCSTCVYGDGSYKHCEKGTMRTFFLFCPHHKEK